MQPKAMKLAGLAIALLGMVWLSQGIYIQAKALLAQKLLQSAWQQTLQGKSKVKPWAWADTWPVARLRVPSRNIDLIILEGATGRSLAFAPGHMQGTPAPGDRGFSVISAHRDTHFAFLRNLQSGETLHLQSGSGASRTYQVAAMQVVDADNASVPINATDRGLLLVTCYPFDQLGAGSRQRYLVYAIESKSPEGEDV